MEKQNESTHIRISVELKKFIESKGTYGESHDKIIRKLLQYE